MNALSKYLLEEASAIAAAAEKLNGEEVEKALSLLNNCSQNNSKLIISGVGKSGIVARKIAATFSSVGLTSIYLNPLDALHGDIGIVNKGDVCLLLSNSGETSELLEIIQHLKTRKTSCIAITGEKNSSLAKQCEVFINAQVDKEICPLNLAPTTSTTVTMAIGDAFASAWMDINNVSSEQFAFNHPAGSLGRKLTITVKDVMIPKNKLKPLHPKSTFGEIVYQITADGIGCCWIQELNTNSSLIGLITDGDLRRSLKDSDSKTWNSLKAENLMTRNPISILPEAMAIDALKLMEENEKKPISILPVISKDNEFLGFIRLHDLIQKGL